MAHVQFIAGWGWVLLAGVSSTEQPYNRCVNDDNMFLNKHRYNSEDKIRKQMRHEHKQRMNNHESVLIRSEQLSRKEQR